MIKLYYDFYCLFSRNTEVISRCTLVLGDTFLYTASGNYHQFVLCSISSVTRQKKDTIS